jgi:DNA-directed RNA polymerase subunit RPC12/RpoP
MTLKCDNCGAGLTHIDDGVENVQCQYCQSFVRVRDTARKSEGACVDVDLFFNLVQRFEISNKTNIEKLYRRAYELVQNHKFVQANKVLNEIIEEDPKQSLAWYLKSMLPILEQESIIWRGRFVNLNIYARLTTNKQAVEYLRGCGLGWLARKHFRDFYRSKDFLFEQRVEFIDNAISADDGK